MNKFQLKKLIKEVIREVESDVEDPKANSGDESSLKTKPGPGLGKASASHEKEYGVLSDTILKLKLGGINKNNSHIVKDFIAQAAHAAKMADLEVIHAELEKAGKIGLTVDEPEIKKSEEEIGAELDAMNAGDEPAIDPNTKMPSREDWKKMSPEQRDKYIKANSGEEEWDAATERDVEKTREKAKQRKAALKAGTLKTTPKQATDPKTGEKFMHDLPVNTDFWTDDEWALWDTGKMEKEKSGMGGSYKKSDSVQGQKGKVAANFSDTLR